jgi:hypothetical protein
VKDAKKQMARVKKMTWSENKKESCRWMAHIQKILYTRRFWHCRPGNIMLMPIWDRTMKFNTSFYL